MSEKTFIKGKDRDLESTIETMLQKLAEIGIEIEEASSINPVPNVYSVHIRDKDWESHERIIRDRPHFLD